MTYKPPTRLTVGELKALLAALPPEADAWPVSANDEYAITGVTPRASRFGRPPDRLDLNCW